MKPPEVPNTLHTQRLTRDIDVQQPVVQLARWFGVGLVFYALAVALNNANVVTLEGASIWLLLGLALPYLTLAAVFLCSADLVERTYSNGPLWLASLLLLAYVAVAAHVYSLTEPERLALANDVGLWGVLRVLTQLGLPLLFLLPLLTTSGRLGKTMPPIAIAVAVLVLLAGITVGFHILDQIQANAGAHPDFSWDLAYLLPAGTYGFILLVAALSQMRSPWLRPASIVVVALLAISALALAVNDLEGPPIADTWWDLTYSQALRWSHILLIAVFAGWLTRPQTYALSSVCATVLLLSVLGYVTRFSGNLDGLGLFWLVSSEVIEVGAMPLLALLIAENTALPPTTSPVHRRAAID